ncbi:M20/M25/M40 family metallo-hydrolase [Bacillales bacterium AN1005]|uniref:M20/M25/M40 family metallo-hydrolase n=1 Tax=Niallia taxi TaxID=2499688 RepID=UPI002E1A4B8B|nr:M20/M25/M40 family metallo-hydrolase [Niallia taxi]MED3963119.1 M20/M25/M40 family metallo-hydrolase [Niallia taxi]
MLQKGKLSINLARLKTDIEELGEFGRNDKGGLDRTTFTSSELAAREWLKSRLCHSNLVVKVDEAANIWGKRKGAKDLPSIVFGSHIDTVPNGGKYDGALGVLMALEVLRVLEENGIVTRHPLEFVSFSAEEPNPLDCLHLVAGRLAAN